MNRKHSLWKEKLESSGTVIVDLTPPRETPEVSVNRPNDVDSSHLKMILITTAIKLYKIMIFQLMTPEQQSERSKLTANSSAGDKHLTTTPGIRSSSPIKVAFLYIKCCLCELLTSSHLSLSCTRNMHMHMHTRSYVHVCARTHARTRVHTHTHTQTH